MQNKNVVSHEISFSYDRTTSYPTESVFFHVSKMHIGINLSTYYLKSPSTQLNGSSSSDGNQLAFDDLFCNTIYTSPG